MLVLADFDNIPELEKRKGPVYLVETILTRIVSLGSNIPSRVKVRFYGGWYDGQRMSFRAQSLSAELQRDFPRRSFITAVRKGVLINAELALATLSEPHFVLTHTFRRRGVPNGLRCIEETQLACTVAACGLSSVRTFIDSGVCPTAGCRQTKESFMYRAEQKLVDIMLASDLTIASENLKNTVVLVSSDDDFVPVIRRICHGGHSVIHLHSQPSQQTPRHYQTGLRGNYVTGPLR